MCTSPTTVYSCGHTKPDHIIEFCYADNEGNCSQIHTRFEHLTRKCPSCTRKAHDELERKRGTHEDEDEDVVPISLAAGPLSPCSSSMSPGSTSPSSSPKGEPTPAAKYTAAKVDQQLSAANTTEVNVVASLR